MTPQQFVKTYFDEVIESNLKHYRELYIDGCHCKSNDDASAKILGLISNLSNSDRETLLLFARPIMIDTSSNIFGIIDGSSYFSSPDDAFDLICNKKHTLSGDLQALFLEEDEARRSPDDAAASVP